jgi:hypothetical protein
VSQRAITPVRTVTGLQHLLRLTEAFEQLPDRCREVVWMRKIEDVPQKVIAFAVFYAVLGIPIARWTDRGNRVTILSLGAAFLGAAVALTSAALASGTVARDIALPGVEDS